MMADGQARRSSESIALAAAGAVASISAVAVSAASARLLPLEDFADLRRVIVVFALVAPLVSGGIGTALLHNIDAEDSQSSRYVVTGIAIVASSWAVVTLVSAFILAPQISTLLGSADLASPLRAFSLVALGQNLLAVLGSAFVAQRRIWRAALSASVPTALSLFLIVSFRPDSLAAIINLMALAWVAPTAVALTISVPSIGRTAVTSRKDFRTIWAVASPLMLSSGAGKIHQQTDKIVVGSNSNSEDFAEYSAGAIEIPLLGVITSTVSSLLQRDFSGSLRGGNSPDSALSLQCRSSVAVSSILFPACVFLFIFAPEIIQILFGSAFSGAVPILRIYLLLIPSRVLMWPTLLTAAGHSRVIFRITIATLIVNIVGTIVAIRLFGIYAAAGSTVLTHYGVRTTVGLRLTAELLSTAIGDIVPWSELGRVAALAVASAAPALAAASWMDGPALVQISVGLLGQALGMAGLFFRREPWVSLRKLLSGRAK